MRFDIGGRRVDAFRVANFTASKQRGKISLIGKSMGRSSDHRPILARSITVTLSKKYEVEFYQRDRKLVIVVNGAAVWIDNAIQPRDADGRCGRRGHGTKEADAA